MQEGVIDNVSALGRRLSIEIGCPVSPAALGKNVLVCHHNIAFSMTRLRESIEWQWAKEKHDKEVN